LSLGGFGRQKLNAGAPHQSASGPTPLQPLAAPSQPFQVELSSHGSYPHSFPVRKVVVGPSVHRPLVFCTCSENISMSHSPFYAPLSLKTPLPTTCTPCRRPRVSSHKSDLISRRCGKYAGSAHPLRDMGRHLGRYSTFSHRAVWSSLFELRPMSKQVIISRCIQTVASSVVVPPSCILYSPLCCIPVLALRSRHTRGAPRRNFCN
jgi:hypothetical protein